MRHISKCTRVHKINHAYTWKKNSPRGKRKYISMQKILIVSAERKSPRQRGKEINRFIHSFRSCHIFFGIIHFYRFASWILKQIQFFMICLMSIIKCREWVGSNDFNVTQINWSIRQIFWTSKLNALARHLFAYIYAKA